MSESESLAHSGDPYLLLKCYKREAKTHSLAFKYSEAYYRQLYKYLSYPLIIIAAASTVLAGIGVYPYSNYIVMGLSMLTLVLTGYNQLINPARRERDASQIRVEMGELYRSIKQFILSNDRTKEEIKAYCETVFEQINIWVSLAPPIQDRFVEQAKKEMAKRTRPHRMTYGSVRDSSIHSNRAVNGENDQKKDGNSP